MGDTCFPKGLLGTVQSILVTGNPLISIFEYIPSPNHFLRGLGKNWLSQRPPGHHTIHSGHGKSPNLQFRNHSSTKPCFQAPGTRDKGPETRDQGQGTRDKGQGTGDKGPGTRDQGQGTRDTKRPPRGNTGEPTGNPPQNSRNREKSRESIS